jgi:hypothetical protein
VLDTPPNRAYGKQESEYTWRGNRPTFTFNRLGYLKGNELLNTIAVLAGSSGSNECMIALTQPSNVAPFQTASKRPPHPHQYLSNCAEFLIVQLIARPLMALCHE